MVTLVRVMDPSASLTPPPVTLSGAYVGAANSSALSAFTAWRGSSAPIVLDYLGQDAWSDISNPRWLLDEWQSFHQSGGQLVLSVPMLVSSPTGSFAAGVAGHYDAYFASLGQQLVADGYDSIILRMGWEFNGNWFPWSVQTGSATMRPQEFVAYWRHLVDLFRAIPGSKFGFDWTINNGSDGEAAIASYPGSKYVDYIGVDLYDRGWAPDGGPISDPATRWNQIVNQQYGLNWWLAFAQAHHKPISLPEWGLEYQSGWNGGGDDPYFIDQMYAWIRRNHPAYETYFNYGGSVINSGETPLAAAAYQRQALMRSD
jgi:hypothetical protein